MAWGRLIRVGKYRGDREAVSYIVAAAEGGDAIKRVQNELGVIGYTFEDLGRVSEALLKALKLVPGAFVRADDAGRARE
jgi:hypothetical protein